ncbi:MAG: ABC transporter ATP-binding protein [Lachnospiraceae bacterium]|nr:ABC transporter ATP-binding protein [Lachnospiraceae bacterium]
MEQILLKVENLNIEFHDHDVPERVVNQLNMVLHQGEILGIVGESGSGKSMTAMAIAGLLRRHDMKMEGKILFEGNELLHTDRETLRQLQGNQIGIVFQEPMTSLNPVKRIGWQVEESLRIHRPELSKEERYMRVIKALEEVELDNPQLVYKKYPHELSGGMRQRVMIASAMICEPKLLIADEPTTALDVTIQLQIVKLLQRLNQEKKMAVLFISHDLSLVKRLCDRVIVMHNGSMVETGKTEEIFYSPKEDYTIKLISAIPKLEKLV